MNQILILILQFWINLWIWRTSLQTRKQELGIRFFFIREKWHLSRLNSCRDKRIYIFVPDGQSRVENRDKKIVGNRDKIAIL